MKIFDYNTGLQQNRIYRIAFIFFWSMLTLVAGIEAADVITNGNFDSDISTGWTSTTGASSSGSTDWDDIQFGNSSGSVQGATQTNRNRSYEWYLAQTLGNVNATDDVFLSFWWYKASLVADAALSTAKIRLVRPAGDTVDVWTHTQIPSPGSPLSGNVTASDISASFNANGTYTILLYGNLSTPNDKNAQAVNNFDDVIVDIQGGIVNAAPTVTAGATAVSVSPVNLADATTTVISTSFTDSDSPGVSAFNVTFKIREPNNSTELTLVNNLPNGSGGLTISDDGGGNYTASYTYDPIATQTVGLYDLYFEVSDGSDNVIDSYASNNNELELTQLAPTVVAGATAVSKASINRVGTDNSIVSALFTDLDQPGVSAFTVTMKIREPNNSTELILVNAQTDGNGGLTITDGGSGNYTASYTYDPGAAQTIGLYDIYFEVTDGVANAIDGFANNIDEFDIYDAPPNNPPTMTAGTTTTSISPVNRYSTNITIISATYTDADQPGINAFNVIFKVREPDNSTELILINDLTHGAGGLTVTDNGGGSYTAQYSYNPDDAQALGLYDLYFEVSDGTDNLIDNYTANSNELEINETLPPFAPTIAAGATSVSLSPVTRLGSASTVFTATFNDGNSPTVGSFLVTIKVREPDNSTELILVNALSDGNGGLTVIDNGGGSYTASFSFNPGDAQTVGLYDLYFEIDDNTGTSNAIDSYANNNNELEINSILINQKPVIVASATTASPTSLDRVGAATTTLSVTFSDGDDPGINEFYISLATAAPFFQGITLVADSLKHGQGGLTIVNNGGGSYTASISWDPPDNAVTGYYDLKAIVADASEYTIDDYTDNPNELLISNGGENSPPVVSTDAVFASPAGVERIGANPTTISATFTDGDAPAISQFRVSFKIREPDNSTEIIMATNAAHGASGVTIIDQGGGVYTASVSWDPPDAQTLGNYDLYFDVTDQQATSYDDYVHNLDELEIYDAISNIPPTLTAGNTFVLPTSVNRIGDEFTMIKSTFTDLDLPGPGAFTITIKVRDQSSTEYTLVNAAKHDEQGLRVAHIGAGTYEAAVLWDPAVGQTTGTYDLYVSVEDNYAASIVDDFSSNGDELTITSAAILGDGYLLKRTNNSDNCGGVGSACHNLPDHMGQNCRTCHAPHSTRNIYLVREIISTPNSGNKAVLFKTKTGTLGDPNSGGMADSTDNIVNGVCEVCHTSTLHHRNDQTYTTTENATHNDGADCSGCHTHAEGFPNLEGGGGEGSGGDGCGCHSAMSGNMKGGSSSYHHNILSENGDYNVSAKTCLMCHVNHDIFRPDLNTGIGQRAKNLRVDITTPVVQGDNSVLTNTDYSSTGTGGICLSCHTSTQTKSVTPPDGSTSTRIITKAAYDASDAHNYEAASAYSDASTFNANCVKCHTDTQAKEFQTSATKFGTHDNPYGRILDPFGAASPSDPLEEIVCYGCHSTTSNPNAGSNQDYYAAVTMSSTSLRIENAFGLTYAHPVTTTGRHSENETAAGLADGNRHAECVDCHSVHAAKKGTHDGSNNLVSNALTGAWGVEPTSWPAAPTPSNNANVYAAPASYNKVEPAIKEYQICLKCHSNYTTLPSGSRNIAEEMNPNYPSTHGITIANQNPFCNTSTMNEPWASSGIAYCADCHRSDNATDPEGPHGSNQAHLLVATIASDENVGTPLCYVCHSEATYWSDRNSGANSRYGKHPSVQGSHASAAGCFACHMWDHAATPGLGVTNQNDWPGGAFGSGTNLPDIPINIHGSNRKWVYNEESGGTGSGDQADAFVNGFISDMNYANKQCWTETCKNHSPQSY